MIQSNRKVAPCEKFIWPQFLSPRPKCPSIQSIVSLIRARLLSPWFQKNLVSRDIYAHFPKYSNCTSVPLSDIPNWIITISHDVVCRSLWKLPPNSVRQIHHIEYPQIHSYSHTGNSPIINMVLVADWRNMHSDYSWERRRRKCRTFHRNNVSPRACQKYISLYFPTRSLAWSFPLGR